MGINACSRGNSRNGNEISNIMKAIRRKIDINSIVRNNNVDIIAYCSSTISSDRNIGAIVGNYVKGIHMQQCKDYDSGYKLILKGKLLLILILINTNITISISL